jgi:hypothetical protein
MTSFIHTSDRLSFKRCRRRWNWASHLRGNLKPVKTARPLQFGSAIHRAMEVYYNPVTWNWVRHGTPEQRAVVERLVLDVFREEMLYDRRTAIIENDDKPLNAEEEAEWQEHLELGQGMLRHYFTWAPPRDTFTPIGVEIDFYVLIPDVLDEKGEAVYYRGRIDLLVQDDWGYYWIIDHKTTARMDDGTEHLELDEQMGSYQWALEKQLGIPIAGSVYNELYKGYPQPPTMNKVQRQGRWFSVNKTQDTSYAMYLQTLIEYNEPIELYREVLDHFRLNGKQWFRRTQIHRSPHEMKEMGERISMEAMDMVDPNIRLYPNPSRFSCRWCPFRTPCLMVNDGSDVQWILNSNFRKGSYVDPDDETDELVDAD